MPDENRLEKGSFSASEIHENYLPEIHLERLHQCFSTFSQQWNSLLAESLAVIPSLESLGFLFSSNGQKHHFPIGPKCARKNTD